MLRFEFYEIYRADRFTYFGSRFILMNSVNLNIVARARRNFMVGNASVCFPEFNLVSDFNRQLRLVRCRSGSLSVDKIVFVFTGVSDDPLRLSLFSRPS